MQAIAIRLKSGQDVFNEIKAIVAEKKIEAGCVLSAVGSLAHARIRFADQQHYSEFDGPFEIVSMTGTVSLYGSHLHISISDEDGKTIGGHLESGCKIYTTVELVMLKLDDVAFKREYAKDSGYEELTVYKK